MNRFAFKYLKRRDVDTVCQESLNLDNEIDWEWTRTQQVVKPDVFGTCRLYLECSDTYIINRLTRARPVFTL